MNFVIELLRCPECSASLRETASAWECSECRAHGIIDAAGVIHLPPAGNGRSVNREPLNRIDADSPRQEISDRIGEALPSADEAPSEFWSLLSGFRPNPAGFAILGAAHRGTTSLALSSGWGNLPHVISSFGGRAVAMDSFHQGLVYTSRADPNGNGGCVLAPVTLPLPFADGSFDTVFLNDAQIEIAGVRDDFPHESPEEALLRECRRLLKPGGRIVFLAWNLAFLRRGAPAPELGREDREPHCSRATKSGFVKLIRQSGFENPECFIPWPDPDNWTRLIPESRLSEEGLPLQGRTLKRTLGRIALGASTLLGVSEYLVPSYCLVARSPSQSPANDTHAPSTLEVIARAVDVDPSAVTRIDSHPNSKCLSFRANGRFVKIPLTRGSASRLSAASRILDGAPVALKRDAFIVAPEPGVHAKGIPLGVYPLIPHDDPNTDWSDKVVRTEHAFERLAEDGRIAKLEDSDFWRRVTGRESRDDLVRLGLADGIWDSLRSIGSRSIPVGLVHGDLAWGNLIRDEQDRILLIDWDRCERQSPKYLDTVHGCHSLARTRHFLDHPENNADRIIAGWELLMARDRRLPLLDHVDASRGEISWNEAIGLTILNEIDQHNRTLRSDPILRRVHQERLMDRMKLVRDCLSYPSARAV